MNHSIQCANPREQYLSQKRQINSAIRGVLNDTNYILGKHVEKFEFNFAQYIGSKHCVGVNSGTDAIIFALRALGVREGDEVLVPSHTAVATASAIVSAGATPVFLDINLDFYTLDVEQIETMATSKTKAIIAVHLYGHPCDMDKINYIARKLGIFVIEDCAQAHGSMLNNRKIGTLSDISCFSFYPTKNLGAIGDGGAITTDDPVIADKVRKLRQYGWDNQREAILTSGVSRLDELQAAILNVKLPKLDENNSKRRLVAKLYSENLRLDSITKPTENENAKHVYHLYVVRVKNRDKVVEELNVNNIFPGIHYKKPVHMHKAFKDFVRKENLLLNTENVSNEILSLPMYPELRSKDVFKICKILNSICI